MDRSESKYFNTSQLMDEAFILLLNDNEIESITIKEICQKAGVNRSTFYLHYESISDLINEAIEYSNKKFSEYMKSKNMQIISRLNTCKVEELHFVTKDYLIPYLSFIKENKKLFLAAISNSKVLDLGGTFGRMSKYVFGPIMEKFNVPSKEQKYLIGFYVHGLMSIIEIWLRDNCNTSVEEISSLMIKCVEKGRNE